MHSHNFTTRAADQSEPWTRVPSAKQDANADLRFFLFLLTRFFHRDKPPRQRRRMTLSQILSEPDRLPHLIVHYHYGSLAFHTISVIITISTNSNLRPMSWDADSPSWLWTFLNYSYMIAGDSSSLGESCELWTMGSAERDLLSGSDWKIKMANERDDANLWHRHRPGGKLSCTTNWPIDGTRAGSAIFFVCKLTSLF